MDEIEEDEDVIIEGSDLHKALLDMGYTDFEFTSLSKKDFPEDLSHQDKSLKWTEQFYKFCECLYPVQKIFAAPKANSVSRKQLSTILKMESLLDDHAAVVRSIFDKNSQSFWSKVKDWSTLMASTTILGVSYLVPERKNTAAVLFASLLTAISLHQKYEEFYTVKSLNNVVCLQNELYNLYKKGLRVLRKSYQLRTDAKQAQNKFSNLEIERLKYLQPMTETLLKSMENVSRFYYQASAILVKMLPKAALCNFTLSNFEDDSFTVDGEITYSVFRQLYYVYILTQSDTMQLLAFAYDRETWTEKREIPHSQLTRIACNLCRLLRNEKTKLMRVIEEYENCKTRPIQRIYRGPAGSKWKDLYLNLDLLSRKIQTTYDTIGSILEEIEKRKDLASTDDDFVAALTPRINEIYKQIDTARNFAEFNNLLMAMLQRSRRGDENPIVEETELEQTEIERDLPIIRNSDPQIIDEVFEEYITEEYLKPIYDETDDDATMESAKLNKLLAKNFMSELKEALIDKYKSMSEREAKALLRKYRESNGNTNVENKTNCSVSSENDEKPIIIPRPPPLPEAEPRIIAVAKQKRESRPPVPLPRSSPQVRYRETASPESLAQRFSMPPPPPHFPSRIDSPVKPAERMQINLPRRNIDVPAFVTFDEEFIGSGENSDEELQDSDCEEDREFVGEQDE